MLEDFLGDLERERDRDFVPLQGGTLTPLIEDSWDLVVREKRYVRQHEQPRAFLFNPALEGKDDPGAPSVRLSGERVSVLFFENGECVVWVDQWTLMADALRLSTQTKGRGLAPHTLSLRER